MDFILEFKRWKLFFLLVGIPGIFQFIVLGVMISRHNPGAMLSAILIMMIFSIGVFFGWFFSLGTNLGKKLSRPISVELE
ncbi:MAG TPA: hypothetical protein VE978_08575 [Chitinophagales bacterium]|nr:hypothetical protein [Chitinophagales bacterium]